MPGLDGIAATERLRAGGTGPRVLILTTYADDERVRDAIRAGATGYLLKDVLRAQLVQAIHAAGAGRAHARPAGAAAPDAAGGRAAGAVAVRRAHAARARRAPAGGARAWATSRSPRRST